MSKPQSRLLAAPATVGMGEIVRKPHQEGEFTRECIGVRVCVCVRTYAIEEAIILFDEQGGNTWQLVTSALCDG